MVSHRNQFVRRLAEHKLWLGVLCTVPAIVGMLTGAVSTETPAVELGILELQPSLFRRAVERKGVIEPFHSTAVHSSCYWNTTILSIVPEGTEVKKGDVVCVLDSSDIEEFARSRELLLIKYRNRLETARQSHEMLESDNERRLSAAQYRRDSARSKLSEYSDGTLPQQLEKLEKNLSLLSDQANSAADELRHTELLWSMGMVSRGELNRQAQQFNAARQKYDLMMSEHTLLNDFQRPRDLLQLRHTAVEAERSVARTMLANNLASIKSRRTMLSYERTLRIYERYYRRALESIEACTLRAPRDGQVVYGNSWYLLSRGITEIQVGAKVRNLQKVFEIPDPRRLKVSVPLNESLIYDIEMGMSATVKVAGYEDNDVSGRVSGISRYPRQRSSHTPHLKDYWIDVELLPSDEQREWLTPKADTTVELTLSEKENVLQVPRTAVTASSGHNLVFVIDEGELVVRNIELGEANDDYACVVDGLEDGDKLVTEMLPAHKERLQAELCEELGVLPESL